MAWAPTRPARRPRSPRQPETYRNAGDGRRSAHNPEVAGSNPAPATKSAGQRPLPILGGAFLLCLVNVIVNEDGCCLAPSLRAGCRPAVVLLGSAGCLPAPLTLRLVRVVACWFRTCHGGQIGGGFVVRRRVGLSVAGRRARGAQRRKLQCGIARRRTSAGEETAGFGGQLAARDSHSCRWRRLLICRCRTRFACSPGGRLGRGSAAAQIRLICARIRR